MPPLDPTPPAPIPPDTVEDLLETIGILMEHAERQRAALVEISELPDVRSDEAAGIALRALTARR